MFTARYEVLFKIENSIAVNTDSFEEAKEKGRMGTIEGRLYPDNLTITGQAELFMKQHTGSIQYDAEDAAWKVEHPVTHKWHTGLDAASIIRVWLLEFCEEQERFAKDIIAAECGYLPGIAEREDLDGLRKSGAYLKDYCERLSLSLETRDFSKFKDFMKELEAYAGQQG